MKFVLLINLKLLTNENSFLLNIAEHENFSANKYENAKKIGIFIFISRENFMLRLVEHEKRFIILGADSQMDVQILQQREIKDRTASRWEKDRKEEDEGKIEKSRYRKNMCPKYTNAPTFGLCPLWQQYLDA